MPLTAMWRAKLERLPSLMEPLLTLANVALPTIAAMKYACGVVMRVLQIGAPVRETVAGGRRDLDVVVPPLGLFMVPLAVNVRSSQLQTVIELGRADSRGRWSSWRATSGCSMTGGTRTVGARGSASRAREGSGVQVCRPPAGCRRPTAGRAQAPRAGAHHEVRGS